MKEHEGRMVLKFNPCHPIIRCRYYSQFLIKLSGEIWDIRSSPNQINGPNQSDVGDEKLRWIFITLWHFFLEFVTILPHGAPQRTPSNIFSFPRPPPRPAVSAFSNFSTQQNPRTLTSSYFLRRPKSPHCITNTSLITFSKTTTLLPEAEKRTTCMAWACPLPQLCWMAKTPSSSLLRTLHWTSPSFAM